NVNTTPAKPTAFTLGEPPSPSGERKSLAVPTILNIGDRRNSSVADILTQIDRAIQNFALAEDSESSAPTTVLFCQALDGPATGPRGIFGERMKQFPAQI